MAKGDRQAVNTALKQDRDTSNQQFNTFTTSANNNYNNAVNSANRQNDILTQGYQDTYNRAVNVGLDPTVSENLRALNRTHSSAYGSGSGGGGGSDSGGSGGGGGGSAAAPSDPFSASRSAFANFINSGGVDIGAMKEALGGYRTLAESGGYSPEQVSQMNKLIGNLQSIGETGGVDPNDLASMRSNIDILSGIGKTGGYDPAALANILGDIKGLRTIGQTGGIDPTGLARMRGNGVFDEFAKTGGYSDSDIANIRARSISPIGALYENDRADLERANRLSGGASSPAFAAALARTQRARGQGLADATRNAEVDIQDAVRRGRMTGAQNLSNAENDIQTLMSSNKLTGLTAAAQGESTLSDNIAKNQIAGANSATSQLNSLNKMITDAKLSGNTQAANALTNMANSIASTKLGALGGITDTQQGAESIAQQGKIAGAQGMFGVESATEQARQAAAAQAAAEAAAAAQTAAYERAQNAADEQFWAQFGAGNEQYIGNAGLQGQGMSIEGQLGALGGLNTTYGTTPGAPSLYGNQTLTSMAGRAGATAPTLQMQQQNIGPSVFDRIMQVGGLAAGALTGGLGGFGNRNSGSPTMGTLPNYRPGAPSGAGVYFGR